MTGCGGGGGTADRSGGVTAGGPLAGVGFSSATASNVVTVSQEVGREMMFGTAQVVNDGPEPVTIDRIRITGLPRQFRVTHTYAAGAERRDTFNTQVDWSASRLYPRLNRAAGYVVEPGGRERRQSTQLLFIIRATAPGVHRSTKVAVDYHVGSRRYRRVLGNGFAACIVPKGDPVKCPDEDEARTPAKAVKRPPEGRPTPER